MAATIYTSNGSKPKHTISTYDPAPDDVCLYGVVRQTLYLLRQCPLGRSRACGHLRLGEFESVYDPCPEGVPAASRYTWTAFENYVFPENHMWSERSTTAIGSQRFRGDAKGRFIPYRSGTTIFWLDRDGVAVILTGRRRTDIRYASIRPSIQFEINRVDGPRPEKGKGPVRCVRG